MDNDDDEIECSGGEPVHIGEDGTKYYTEILVHDLRVALGDFVRVNLDEPDEAGEMFAFAQVLAFYEDDSQFMFAEVRWFAKPEEVCAIRKKRFT